MQSLPSFQISSVVTHTLSLRALLDLPDLLVVIGVLIEAWRVTLA